MDFEWLATLGVGGVLAGVIFYFYHEATQKHDKQRTEDMRRMEAYMLAAVVSLKCGGLGIVGILA